MVAKKVANLAAQWAIDLASYSAGRMDNLSAALLAKTQENKMAVEWAVYWEREQVVYLAGAPAVGWEKCLVGMMAFLMAAEKVAENWLTGRMDDNWLQTGHPQRLKRWLISRISIRLL